MLGQTYEIQLWPRSSGQIVHNDGDRGLYRGPLKDKGELEEDYSIRAALKA